MGFLNNFINNFFSSLKDNLADAYSKEADKAGMHPEAKKVMDQMEIEYGDLLKKIRGKQKENKI